MILAIIQWLLILPSGVSDRFRGDAELTIFKLGRKIFDLAWYGATIGFIAFSYPADGYPLGRIDGGAWLLFMVSFGVAMTIGYASPWGAVTSDRPITQGKYHWWQFGPLKSNAFLALLFRGLIGSLCVSYVCISNGVYSPMFSIPLSFVIAPYLSRFLLLNGLVSEKLLTRWNIGKKDKTCWNFAEFLRGTVNGFANVVIKC